MQQLTISHNGYQKIINPNDILFFQAEGNYTEIKMVSGEKYLVCKCLKTYAILKQFYNYKRIHAKYLVNMEHAKMVSKKHRLLFLNIDGLTLPIARSRISQIFE